MILTEYIELLLNSLESQPLVVRVDIVISRTQPDEAYLRGQLALVRGYRLDVAEYLIADDTIHRIKYRYHLQDGDSRLVRRWDNAPHHPQVRTFPHHCHMPDGDVIASLPMDIPAVLRVVGPLLD